MLRTLLTLKPGRPGTKKLVDEYGSRLVCVRFRHDEERQTRCKTIELVVEEVPWPPQSNPNHLPPYANNEIVHLRTFPAEVPLQRAIKHLGGQWHPESATWSLAYKDALALRLIDRIVIV